MHAQRGLRYLVCVCVCVCVCVSVCLSVCLMALILALRATRRPKSDNQRVQCHTGLIFKQAIFVTPLGSKLCREKECKSLYANEYCLTSTVLFRFTLWKHQKLLKGQVVSQRPHSNTTYEYSYPVGVRNDWLWPVQYLMWGCILASSLHPYQHVE